MNSIVSGLTVSGAEQMAVSVSTGVLGYFSFLERSSLSAPEQGTYDAFVSLLGVNGNVTITNTPNAIDVDWRTSVVLTLTPPVELNYETMSAGDQAKFDNFVVLASDHKIA